MKKHEIEIIKYKMIESEKVELRHLQDSKKGIEKIIKKSNSNMKEIERLMEETENRMKIIRGEE